MSVTPPARRRLRADRPGLQRPKKTLSETASSDDVPSLASLYLAAGAPPRAAAALARAWKQGTRFTIGLRVSAVDLIAQIIDARAADIEGGLHRANADRIAQHIARPRRAGGEPAALDLSPIDVSSRVTVTLRKLIRELVRSKPDITKREVVNLITDAWPPARGARAKARRLFSPELVPAAHEMLLKENPSWGCRAACEELAARLRTTPRTIEAHLARARRK